MPNRIPIEPYDDFFSECGQLTSKAQSQIYELLKILGVNPYEPNLQRKCLIHGDGERFEYEVDGGIRFFGECIISPYSK